MKKHSVLYISLENLISILKDERKIDYKHLGIQLSNRFALCQVLFYNRRLDLNPNTLYIDSSSYSQERIKVVEYIIYELLILNHQLGRAKITLEANIRTLMYFLNWADKEKVMFSNIKEARNAYMLYTQSLKEKIRSGENAPSTAYLKQNSALKMLKYLNQDVKNEINVGINKIPNSNGTSTEKSSSVSQKIHFNFYYSLFHQLTDFLLEGKSFPHKLTLSNKKIWLLPAGTTFITANNSNRYIAFDYLSGNTRSKDEIKSIKQEDYVGQAHFAIRDYNHLIANGNKDMSSTSRLMIGSKAIYAFFMIFLSITGMNDSTAGSLEWNDDYLIEKDYQNFRNIKYRAGNKVVEFQIQKKFINDFKKYLKLRDFVLNRHELDSLFFMGYGDTAYKSKKQESGSFSSYIGLKIGKNIDPALPIISSRRMRVNKTHQVIKKSGIIAASELAQSSKKTIMNAYLGETQESTDEQLTDFFTKLNNNIIFTNEKSVSINVGQCKGYENPKTRVSLEGIKIDCKQSEGCLFCEHYGCHADEIDIRKLLSLQYIIDECKYIAHDETHHNKVYGTVIDRINSILHSIELQVPAMTNIVTKIRNDVFENQNLHYYWEHKLALLIETGMIP